MKILRDRYETGNNIICKCVKLAQNESKTRHDWVEKVILLEIVQEIKI